MAADPGLNAKPAAGHQRAQQGRHVRAFGTERSAAINRKGNSVKRSCMGVEDHWDKHDKITKKNSYNGLPPIHTASDERRGKHVSRDAGRHGNPKGSETPQPPLAP